MDKNKSTSNSKIITCKAAVVWKEGVEGVKVEEIQVDPPKSSEVRVRMLFASLCHTDLLYCNGHPFPLFPRVLGHEGVGIVESVGEGVREVKEGDTVMPTYIGECGECENCSSGKTNLCLTHPLPFDGLMPDGTSRMSITTATAVGSSSSEESGRSGGGGGEQKQKQKQMLYQHFSCSTWCEYIVIDVNYVVKVDPRIPLPHASFMSCGYSTGFGATLNQVLLRPGSTVAVFGLGAVGLGVVEGARIQGAGRIIGVDVNERKREKGLVFGITDFINPNSSSSNNKPISEMVKELTPGGMGVDYCFECTGVASLVNEALLSTKMGIEWDWQLRRAPLWEWEEEEMRRLNVLMLSVPVIRDGLKDMIEWRFNKGIGTAVVIGAGNAKSGEIDLVPLLCGRTLKGSIFGGLKVKSDLPSIFHKCLNNELNLDELLTHQVTLDEIQKAFQLMKQPDCVKVLIKF